MEVEGDGLTPVAGSSWVGVDVVVSGRVRLGVKRGVVSGLVGRGISKTQFLFGSHFLFSVEVGEGDL